jgi:hypothetical protein
LRLPEDSPDATAVRDRLASALIDHRAEAGEHLKLQKLCVFEA